MKRETVAIDRKRILAALNAVEQALVKGDVAAGLRALIQVYRLVGPSKAS